MLNMIICLQIETLVGILILPYKLWTMIPSKQNVIICDILLTNYLFSLKVYLFDTFRAKLLEDIEKEGKQRKWYFEQIEAIRKKMETLPVNDKVHSIQYFTWGDGQLKRELGVEGVGDGREEGGRKKSLGRKLMLYCGRWERVHPLSTPSYVVSWKILKALCAHNFKMYTGFSLGFF